METIRVVAVSINSRALFPDRVDKYFKVVMQLTNSVRVVECDGSQATFLEVDIDSFYWSNEEWGAYCERMKQS